MRRYFILLTAALLLAACGGATPTTGPGQSTAAGATPTARAATAPPAASTPQPPANGAAASDITVTLTGGPDAGTYEAHPTENTCSKGIAGEGVWGNQFSAFDFDGFSSLQLIVDAADAADGTDEFLTTISFGVLFAGDQRDYNIDTREDAQAPTGSGTVTLQDTGSSATVTIVGETDDGVGINATIQCNAVLRA